MDYLVQSNLYNSVYVALVCCLSLIVFFYTVCHSNFNTLISQKFIVTILLMFVVIILFVGFRPISYYFVDMGNYNVVFKQYVSNIADGTFKIPDGDYLFNCLMAFFAFYNSPILFFFSCYLLYSLCHLYAARKWFDKQWVYPLVMLIMPAFYYAYGVNGIRNGLGAAIFLLGLSQQGIRRWLLFVIAYNFHASMLLPIAAVLVFSRYKNIYAYLYIWVACLLISLITPNMTLWLAELSIFNDKLAAYATGSDGISQVGFRLDFVLYSLLPILIGFYFVVKYKFSDLVYNEILSVYLICNAFWLLIIRIPYSNRFVYLSWFMYGLVIAYPFIKSNSFRYQNRYAAFILLFLLIFNVVFLY